MEQNQESKKESVQITSTSHTLNKSSYSYLHLRLTLNMLNPMANNGGRPPKFNFMTV